MNESAQTASDSQRSYGPGQTGSDSHTSDGIEELLALAHVVVTWTTQDTLRKHAAGVQHLIEARQEYLRTRVDYFAARRPLTSRDSQGCTCNPHKPDRESCLYHYAAALQPWNHRIPWNCPTYFDGCNCSGGLRDGPVQDNYGSQPTDGGPGQAESDTQGRGGTS